MFQLPSFNFFSGSSRSSSDDTRSINIPSVKIHDIETSPVKETRTLKHLLRANHVNHSVIYHDLEFHNHMPHILGSAYLYGADPDHLNTIYDKESKELEPWKDSPGEISKHDWRDYLGERRYQRAYVDFFEDELVQYGYDWKKLAEDYLFSGKDPLINNVISGLGHPVIHLGYAYELSNRTIAMEAMTLAACFHDPSMAKYLSDPSYTRPAEHPTSSITEILSRVFKDKTLDGLFPAKGADNIAPLLREHEHKILEYWNSWKITDPTAQFEESQRVAVLMLVGTHKPGAEIYDFFLVHLLTSSHAVRILLPLIPTKFHVSLVRQWWLFTLLVYIAQLRPPIQEDTITDFDPKDKDWKWIQKEAISSKWSIDAHYVKALRAMQSASETWSDSSSWYLRAAVRFASEFNNWGGFGPLTQEDLNFTAKYRKWTGVNSDE
ncbi:MAG: ER membrane complex subunit 3 [Chaenotheca gracillima]|nr:MAG: ER membrane complex subunit 3 [Chaenotheca gracillima]